MEKSGGTCKSLERKLYTVIKPISSSPTVRSQPVCSIRSTSYAPAANIPRVCPSYLYLKRMKELTSVQQLQPAQPAQPAGHFCRATNGVPRPSSQARILCTSGAAAAAAAGQPASAINLPDRCPFAESTGQACTSGLPHVSHKGDDEG